MTGASTRLVLRCREGAWELVAKKLDVVPHIQFAHQIHSMHLDGPDTDRQAVGNFLTRVSPGDQMEYLALPWRERGVSIRQFAQIPRSEGLPGAVSTGKRRLMGARHIKPTVVPPTSNLATNR